MAMRVVIIYFSQTGNTRKVAEAIREQMIGDAGHCDLMRLEEADPVMLSGYDLIGFGVPAFYFREPINAHHFFREMSDQSINDRPKPFFFFVTHGGTPGDVYSRIDRMAHSRSLETIGFFQCLGVDTFPPFADRKPLTAFGHPDQNDLLMAKEFAKDVIQKAGVYFDQGDPKRPKIPGNWITRAVAGFFSEQKIRLRMRQHLLPAKNILAEKCTRCGLCAEQCPVRIIELKPHPVIDESGCIACYNCQRVCPTGAVQCDWRLFKLISGEYIRPHKKPASRY